VLYLYFVPFIGFQIKYDDDDDDDSIYRASIASRGKNKSQIWSPLTNSGLETKRAYLSRSEQVSK